MDKEKYYTLNIISKILGVHHQTLRIYEKRGLIKPSKIKGKTHLYSEKDIEKIKRIIRLTNEFGVNLAGVEIILEMRDKLVKLKEENRRLRKENARLKKEKEILKKAAAYFAKETM